MSFASLEGKRALVTGASRGIGRAVATELAQAGAEVVLGFRSGMDEAESLAEALAARKSIERAKGLLMEREGLSEQEAFARLRRASQVSGRPLRVVADALIATFAAD